MGRLLLVRHGMAGYGDGRYWGRTDVALTGTGVRQVERLCRRLAQSDISAVYSSDLGRCLQTAEILSGPHDVSVVPCPDLREVDFGAFEGLTFGEIQQRDPDAARYWTESGHERFPNGEAVDDLIGRVDRFLGRLSIADGQTLIVAHAGSLRALLSLMIGRPSAWWRLRIDCASLSVVEIAREGRVLCLLNDVCHLNPQVVE